MKEEFRDIKGYEGLYQVSNKGRVFSLKKQRLMTGNSFRNGYPSVVLTKCRKERCKAIHRLVAEAFIPNPNNYPIVNHKDEDRTNNNVDNLEWCTYKYNDNYGTRNKRVAKSLGVSIIRIDKNGNETIYGGLHEAARELGILATSICNVLKGRSKIAGGYFWKYKEV